MTAVAASASAAEHTIDWIFMDIFLLGGLGKNPLLRFRGDGSFRRDLDKGKRGLRTHRVPVTIKHREDCLQVQTPEQWRESGGIMRHGLRLTLIAVICLATSACLDEYLGKAMPENLRQHGIDAQATILSIWDTGWTVNDDPVIGIRVEVHPQDRPAFQATIGRYTASRIAIPRFQPGKNIRVRFDPQDLNSIAVDE